MESILLLVVFWQSAEVPAPLVNMIEARQSLVTGNVQWDRIRITGKNKRMDRLHSRVAGGQRLLQPIESDDQPQQVLLDEEGKPVIGPGGAPYIAAPSPRMLTDEPGILWQRKGDSSIAQHYDASIPFAEHQIPDPRCLGIGHTGGSGNLELFVLGELGNADAAPTQYESRHEDGLDVVSVFYPFGSRVFWIDSKRGWNPVKTQTRNMEGAVQYETVTELGKMDDYWFPSKIETFRFSESSQPILLETVVIHAAAFNQPDDKLVLEPEDIGIKIGMNVELISERFSVLDTRVFDGHGLLSADEFRRRKTDGELAPSNADIESGGCEPPPGEAPSANAEEAALSASAALSGRLSDWERYTQTFIDCYNLNDEQTRTAFRILRNAQSTANRVIASRSENLLKLERELQAARTSESDGAVVQRLRSQIDQLLKPIESIFERQLKARLERIPTRQQRQIASGTPDGRNKK